MAKAMGSRADAVILGTPLAAAAGAPDRARHWGMATSAPALPHTALDSHIDPRLAR